MIDAPGSNAAARKPRDAMVLRDQLANTPWVSTPVSSASEASPLLRISWTRAGAALRRYKWLAAGIVLVGTVLGIAATRLMAPQYEVHATVWISNENNGGDDRNVGPIRGAEVLRETSWPELMTSFAILDKVVRKLSLNVQPERAADSTALTGLQ